MLRFLAGEVFGKGMGRQGEGFGFPKGADLWDYMKTMFVKPFSQISKSDAAIAGGKGASLGEMTRAGIPVPPGFVILADAFEQFLRETDLIQEIDAILDSVNHNEMHTVERASEKIQALILAAKMPKDIASEIEADFKALDAEFVAVRSSATAEDSLSAAWAGQLDTFLNTPRQDLLKNVQKCWASLFTPRAIFYRFEKELHKTKISVAVVVQKMIDSEISGIAFSVHPVTEDQNQLIIEAGYGLGEAVVSGQITPDSYVVEKEPRRIIDTNIAKQERALFRATNGGNDWAMVPYSKQSAQKLTDAQVLDLSAFILRIEKHYGFPCDIEWAFANDTFYITQSRPITTLAKGTESKIVLEKMFTRPHSLFYATAWRDSNCKRAEKWLGYNLTETIHVRPDNTDELQTWYSDHELQKYRRTLEDKIRTESGWFEKLVADFEKEWTELEEFLKRNEPLSKEELHRFYEHWLTWWEPMAIMMQIPEVTSLPEEIRNKAYELRAKTQEHSDKGDEIYLAHMQKFRPDFADYFFVLTPEEVFSKRYPEKTELEKRKQGWYMTADSFGLIADLPDALQQRHFVMRGIASSAMLRKFFAANGSDKLFVYKADYMPLLVIIDWLSYYDGDIEKNVYPFFGYKKAGQEGKAYINLTRYHEVSQVAFRGYMDGRLTIPRLDEQYARAAKQIEETYTAYHAEQSRTEDDLLHMLSESVQELYDLDRASLFLDFLDQNDIETVLKELKTDVDLGAVWKLSEIPSFLSFDSHNTQEILNTLEAGRDLSFLQYIYTNYTHVPNADEVRRRVSELDVEDLKAELKINRDRAENGKKRKDKDALALSETERKVLAFIDWSSELRDIRKVHLNKVDALIYNLTSDLFRAWQLPQELVPVSFAFDVLKGKKFIQGMLETLKKRKEKIAVVYYGGDSYEEDFDLPEEEVRAFDERLLDEHSVEEGGVLRGQGASRGQATGRVRVVLKKSDFDAFQEGEILVTGMTRPEFVPLMKKASAIVTDEGGITSHAAIVSRELGKPCVIGTQIATHVLKTGDSVEVDADSGVVRVL